jgi:hypothetical protein
LRETDRTSTVQAVTTRHTKSRTVGRKAPKKGRRVTREVVEGAGNEAAAGNLRVTLEHAGGEDVGRAAVVAASADPARVVGYANDAVAALGQASLAPAALAEFVRRFQVAYGQGLAADGAYGPATRTALSRILDVLPRNLPPVRRAGPSPAPAPSPASPPPPADTPAQAATFPQAEQAPQAQPAQAAPQAPQAQPAQAAPQAFPPTPEEAAAPVPQVGPAQPIPAGEPPPASSAALAPSGAMISREEAARRIREPLTECLVLCNLLSGGLPLSHASGQATRQQLAPDFAAIDRLLTEAGAPVLTPSMDRDFFNVRLAPVAVMGIEISGGLVEDAGALLTDARARAERQIDTLSRYAIANAVGIMSRMRDAMEGLGARVGQQIGRLASLPENFRAAAERLSRFLLDWQRQWDRSFRSFTDGLIGVAGAGTGMLLAIGLILFLVLMHRRK